MDGKPASKELLLQGLVDSSAFWDLLSVAQTMMEVGTLLGGQPGT